MQAMSGTLKIVFSLLVIAGAGTYLLASTMATGDSLTYSNTLEQNRAFVGHSLRPWLVRLERAFSNDADLCPGGAYLQFDLDGLLRADAAQRADIYTKALDPITGWMSRTIASSTPTSTR